MTDRYADWVELILPREGAKDILRALLELAPDVSVLVPSDLADAYHASVAPPKPRKTRARKSEEDG